MTYLPFNKPYITGHEFELIRQAIDSQHLSGNGLFTKKCQTWIEQSTGCEKAILVHSGTAALELAALALEIEPGDEVIMPSFTFVSTANAFVLRGAVPVFVDIRADVLNIDETLIEQAITAKTKAIVPVHYAGVSCEMDAIAAVAKKHGLRVVEDAAHGLGASYKGRALGTIGDIGVLSFHETKNITCGEGGAIIVNDGDLKDRVEVLVEKGTDRRRFLHGLVDKYTWQDVGSSFLPSDIEAAFLYAQLEAADGITAARLQVWDQYHAKFAELEHDGLLRRPVVPEDCSANAHLYHLILRDEKTRNELLSFLNENGVNAVFHYVALHDSPAGLRFGRTSGSLKTTEYISRCLLRLPLWVGMTSADVQRVVELVYRFFGLRSQESTKEQALLQQSGSNALSV